MVDYLGDRDRGIAWNAFRLTGFQIVALQLDKRDAITIALTESSKVANATHNAIGFYVGSIPTSWISW